MIKSYILSYYSHMKRCCSSHKNKGGFFCFFYLTFCLLWGKMWKRQIQKNLVARVECLVQTEIGSSEQKSVNVVVNTIQKHFGGFSKSNFEHSATDSPVASGTLLIQKSFLTALCWRCWVGIVPKDFKQLYYLFTHRVACSSKLQSKDVVWKELPKGKKIHPLLHYEYHTQYIHAKFMEFFSFFFHSWQSGLLHQHFARWVVTL